MIDTKVVTSVVALDKLMTGPNKWIAVIRRDATPAQVEAYANGWPVIAYVECYLGIYLIATTAKTAEWMANRLQSGGFYVSVHDTLDDAELAIIDNASIAIG